MNGRWIAGTLAAIACSMCMGHLAPADARRAPRQAQGSTSMASIELPQPDTEGRTPVEEAIASRRSRRRFTTAALSIEQLAQLLWSAQGVTGEAGRRAAPSAGATYPMEVLVAVGEGTVGDLSAGVYHYLPARHALEPVVEGDVRRQAATAALGQDFVAAAPAVLLIAADYERTRPRYGERAGRYVEMEAGHVGQNVYLQAEALGLGTVAVGAFRDEQVARVFGLPRGLAPLYLMPVGHPG